MVIREKYLNKIRPFYDVDLIKVITGIRRCGKSVLLKQIMDEIINNGISKEHIIYLNFEVFENIEYTDPYALNNYIKSLITDENKYYLFFDEIQNVKQWEKVINSFKVSYNVSIFITGSNSDLLSGELATHIAGRYVSFKISPFNFKELCEFKKIKDRNEMENLFLDYMKWGGLPQTLIFEDEFSKKTYLQDVYNSILIKDITKRFNIKDFDLLNRIINYILTTPSRTFSPGNLVKYFESDNRKISLETIYNYMDYIVKSFIISKAERYDVRGKRILTGKYKYYLTDLGFTQIFSEGKKEQLGGILENIIYNELISRGYNVTVGDVLGHEVDFVATRFEKKIYIQVAYILADDTVIKREFGVYDKINDHFPKYVISTDKYDFSQNGIIHMNVIDFLINEEI